METIERHIAVRESAWQTHRFFGLLDRQPDAIFLGEFAARMTFWPLVFQDVLRVLSESTHAAELDTIVQHHAAEDRDHDLWFLHDLRTLGVSIPDAGRLFGEAHAPARRAAYAVMAEALNVRSGAAKIAMLLAIESTAQVFFTATANFVRRTGYRGLKYFSDHHLLVERSHVAFEQNASDVLRGMAHGDEDLREGIDVVDSCFDAIETMFDSILEAIAAAPCRRRSAGDALETCQGPLPTNE